MSRKKDNTNEESHSSFKDTLKKLASDFQCSVCGVIFTTDEDRKQHLEKEDHGILHEGTPRKTRRMPKCKRKKTKLILIAYDFELI